MKSNALFATTALWLTLVNTSPTAAQSLIDIPAQPLDSALTELATATGLQVTATAEAIEGKMSTAVNDRIAPFLALEKMVSGTGLEVRSFGDAGAVVAMNVVSQNATEDPFDLGSLVLEGTLIDRSVQETTDSVVAATGQELEDRGDADVYDFIDRTPGVIRSGQQRGFAIRGLDQRGFTFGNGLTVATQVDGVTLTNFGTFDGPYSVWDLEQVEVFRGPQGTRQGRSAQAGAIILRSADPTFDQEFRLRGELGQDHTYGAAFVVNTPLGPDTFCVHCYLFHSGGRCPRKQTKHRSQPVS